MLPSSIVRQTLEDMYDCRDEMVPCFIGDPGIGKTQGIYEFAKDHGINVVTFILSNTVPSEVSGIRMPDKESKRMEVFDDMRMASLKDGDILFFDEILEAPPMLWSACLTLIQDRIMASGRKLPDVFIVAASNPVASPGIIPPSTRDRFQFIKLSFDFNNWSKWFEDRFNVTPPDQLRTRIKGDSDNYNILTPRKVTKYYKWLKAGITETKKQIIIDSFDAVTLDLILQMVHAVPSPKRQVIKALMDLEVEGAGDFENMTLKEIMEHLQSLDCWAEIAEALGNISLIEEQDEEVEF